MAKKKSNIVRFEDVRDRIVTIRGEEVILDFAVAKLYGVETREINQAVRNNPRKFPEGWVFELDNQESTILRSKILTLKQTSGSGKGSKYNFKAFTERGLYMLATILKGDQAIETTLTIVDTFAKLRELQRTIGEMAKSPDEFQQKSLMQKSGEIVDDLFGDSFATNETETQGVQDVCLSTPNPNKREETWQFGIVLNSLNSLNSLSTKSMRSLRKLNEITIWPVN